VQISDATNSQGIVQDINFLVSTNDNSYPIADKIRNVNNRFREILTWVWECYNGWKFNDSNQTDDTLYADQTLTSGISVYAIPATAIQIQGAEILLNGGSTWQKLYPVTQELIESSGMLSEWERGSSTPRSYQLIGDSIKILPAPNYTQATSLRVWFLRDVVSFAVTDTTPSPGIPSIFHRALSVGAALDYAIANLPNMIPILMNEFAGANNPNSQKNRIQRFFSRRMTELEGRMMVKDATVEFK
jgi:hypothetical protein